MKNKVTYLQVKEGKVYASGEIQPVLNLSDVKSSVVILNLQTIHKEAMEKFNQSFVEVNPNILINWAESLWLETPNTAGKHGKYICDCEDGLYAAPEGMVMEVKQETIYPVIHPKQPKKQVCTISFEPVEPSKDKEQVPDFENRIVEFMRGITFEYPKHAQYQNGFNDACNAVHNNLREFLKGLQEENKRLKERLDSKSCTKE